MCVYIHININICVQMYIYMYINIYICKYIDIHLHIYVRIYIHIVKESIHMVICKKQKNLYAMMCMKQKNLYAYLAWDTYAGETEIERERDYGVATISRIDKILRLFCRTSSLLQGCFAKETCKVIDPTNQSHPISERQMSFVTGKNYIKQKIRAHILHDTEESVHIYARMCTQIEEEGPEESVHIWQKSRHIFMSWKKQKNPHTCA